MYIYIFFDVGVKHEVFFRRLDCQGASIWVTSIVTPHPPLDFSSLPLHELAKSPELMSDLREMTRRHILVG